MQSDKKYKWTSITIPLGNIDIAQERRHAYDAAAFANGRKKLSVWSREILDQAAGFRESIIREKQQKEETP